MAQENLLRALGIRAPDRGSLGYASRSPSSLSASEDIAVKNCERLSFDLAGFGECEAWQARGNSAFA